MNEGCRKRTLPGGRIFWEVQSNRNKEHVMRVQGILSMLAFLLVSSSILPGCSSSTGSAGSEQGATDLPAESDEVVSVPPIYVKQETVALVNGAPVMEDGYKEQIRLCHAMKHIAVVPIPAGDVEKLGRTVYQFWYQGNHLKGHSVTWSYVMGKGVNSCKFKVVRNVRGYIINDHGAYAINGNTGVAHVDEGAKYMPRAEPAPLSDAARAEEKRKSIDELRKAGQGRMADMVASQKVVKKRIAGQPVLCRNAPLTEEKTCLWSGGTSWGFASGNVQLHSQYFESFGGRLVDIGDLWVPTAGLYLSVEPNPAGGFKMDTLAMSVGKPFPKNEFSLPANIKVEKVRGEAGN